MHLYIRISRYKRLYPNKWEIRISPPPLQPNWQFGARRVSCTLFHDAGTVRGVIAINEQVRVQCYSYSTIHCIAVTLYMKLLHPNFVWNCKLVQLLSRMPLTPPITVGVRSKAWTVFARSNTGVVGSNPTQSMDGCLRLFCVCVVLCVGSGLATGWSPSKEFSRLSIGLRNWKSGQGLKGAVET
jgi:hypothetical protein